MSASPKKPSRGKRFHSIGILFLPPSKETCLPLTHILRLFSMPFVFRSLKNQKTRHGVWKRYALYAEQSLVGSLHGNFNLIAMLLILVGPSVVLGFKCTSADVRMYVNTYVLRDFHFCSLKRFGSIMP